MSKPFDPGPPDKHAESPKKAQRADREQHDKLQQGLEETFPASDPASATQPKKSS
jgi:hypothetical protein